MIAIDTGAAKKDLCLKLGAEKWIDFQQSKDIVKEVRDATGGEGAHSAVVTATSVRMPLLSLFSIAYLTVHYILV